MEKYPKKNEDLSLNNITLKKFVIKPETANERTEYHWGWWGGLAPTRTFGLTSFGQNVFWYHADKVIKYYDELGVEVDKKEN